MTGSNAEDTGPLIIANIGSVANSGPRTTRRLIDHDSQSRRENPYP